MLWTPALLPPHPSTVPSLSPLAQKVIEMIREEERRQVPAQQSWPTNQYRERICGNTLPIPIAENFLHAREGEGFVVNDGSHFFNHQNSVRDNYAAGRITSGQLYDQHKLTTTSFQENVPFSRINRTMTMSESNCVPNDRPSLTTTTLHPPNHCLDEFNFIEPFHCVTSQNKPSINNKFYCEQLSPDMEFDDMEVFSVPHADINTVPKSLEQLKPSIKSNLKPSPSSEFDYRNRLNNKEINRHSWQRHEQLFNKTLNMEPTDQTFVINEKPDQLFKNKLQQYKTTNSIKNAANNLPCPRINQRDARFDVLQTNSIAGRANIDRHNSNEISEFVNKPGFKAEIIPFSARLEIDSEKLNDSQNGISESLIERTMVKYLHDDTCSTSEGSKPWEKNVPASTQDKETGLGQFTNDTTQPLSEPVESLFVRTQDFNMDISNYQDIGAKYVKSTRPLEFSDKKNVAPIQHIELSGSPPKFLVDDLFSLDDFSPKSTEKLLNSPKLHKIGFTLENYSDNITIQEENKVGKVCNSIVSGAQSLSTVTDKAQGNQLNKSSSNVSSSGPGPFVDVIYKTQNTKTNGDDALDLIFGNTAKEEKSNKSIFKENNQKTQTKQGIERSNIKSNLNHKNEQQRKTGSKNYSVEVNVEIYKRKIVTKPVNLKQTTLFDCRKFLPPQQANCKSEAKENENQSEFNGFKKPQLPVSKIKTQSSRANTGFRPQSKITNGHSQTDLKKPGNTQNSLIKAEVMKNCNPSKMIESSLTKSETAKRPSSAEKKPKKKPRFVAPLAAAHTTCQETALKNYTITVLDDVSAREILERFNSDSLKKVIITITFKEGYTLLNKPVEQRKNSQCFPSGVMFLAHWASSRRDYYWLHLLDLNTVDNSVQTVVQNFVSKPEQVVCFESQAVFMLLMDIFHSQNVSSWFALDPLVGCWLLDPDNPPKDFIETSLKLDMDRSLLVVNPKADTKTQACDLLPVLEVAMDLLKQRLTKTSLWTVFFDMEMRLTPLLATMESSSILVDVKKLHETATTLDRHLKQLEKEAHQITNRSFQINSHLQLRQILYDELKLDSKFNVTVKKTEQGSKSTSEAVLLQFKDLHPLPKIVLDFRHLQKVKSTYVDGLIQYIKPDGTIGTTWEQVGAATGRITSKNPNLQAIPKVPVTLPDGEKIQLRAVFKAREGYSFLAADFQQIEFRVFAHFTQDNLLIKAFQEGGDIFQWLAQRWLGGAGTTEREKTKRIVYSVMYGASAYKLAEYLRVNVAEATRIINNFVDIFPSLRSLPKTVIEQCRIEGFVCTLSGRRRLFPNIRAPSYKLRSYSERQAINFLIQGSAADICKAAMLDCDAALRSRGLDAKLLLQIHDELVWEVADRHLQETARTVHTGMEHHWGERLLHKVPVPVCITSGKTLGDIDLLRTVRTAMEHHWGERLLLKVPVPVCITSGKTLGDMELLRE